MLTDVSKLNVAHREFGDEKLIYPWGLRDASYHGENCGIPVSIRGLSIDQAKLFSPDVVTTSVKIRYAKCTVSIFSKRGCQL
jgi:hypothetical protein